jgi:solute carrier family 25 carnitine/acylcarnitine transporter 20/29
MQDDSVVSEFIAGFASGTIQTIVGHPLDTLKVWKQNKIAPEPRSVFSGIKYPLVTGTLVTGIQFASYNWMNKYTDSDVVCGAYSGLFTGICFAPIDKYKIQSQLRITNAKLGLSTCLMREVPAGAIYFGSYSFMKDKQYSVLSSGAIAGASSWFFTYPFDIIKTQVQSGELSFNNAVQKMMRRETIVSNGLGYCLLRAMLVNSIGFYVYESFVTNKT